MGTYWCGRCGPDVVLFRAARTLPGSNGNIMFTGLIQQVGTLVDRNLQGDAGQICVTAENRTEDWRSGESISVEGVCLTLTQPPSDPLTFDVLAETFSRTNLRWKPLGARMNLERALPADGRLGGHIVNGHIDGVGEVAQFEQAGRDRILQIACDTGLMDGVVFKGCVAVNGVSLTVSAVRPTAFEVCLIPETMAHTSLRELQAGHPVNIEIDVIGKYVRHYIEQGRMPEPVEWDRLRVRGLAS